VVAPLFDAATNGSHRFCFLFFCHLYHGLISSVWARLGSARSPTSPSCLYLFFCHPKCSPGFFLFAPAGHLDSFFISRLVVGAFIFLVLKTRRKTLLRVGVFPPPPALLFPPPRSVSPPSPALILGSFLDTPLFLLIHSFANPQTRPWLECFGKGPSQILFFFQLRMAPPLWLIGLPWARTILPFPLSFYQFVWAVSSTAVLRPKSSGQSFRKGMAGFSPPWWSSL